MINDSILFILHYNKYKFQHKGCPVIYNHTSVFRVQPNNHKHIKQNCKTEFLYFNTITTILNNSVY